MLMRLLRDVFGARRSKRLLAEVQRLIDAGDLDSAIRRVDAALEVDDSGPDLHLALADAFQASGEHDRAAFHLERALDRLPRDDPRYLQLMLRTASEWNASDNFADAEKWYRRVLDADPDNLDALLNLAVARFGQSDAEEARALLDRRIALRPDTGTRLRRALLLPAVLQTNDEIDFVRARFERELDELSAARLPPIADPANEVGLTAFYLAYHGRNNAALLRKAAQVSRSLYPARVECPRRLGAGRKLRIGFVSTFFYRHSVGRTTYGLIRDLPRSDFEVHVFAIAGRDDDWARTLRGAADRHVALPASLEQARKAIEDAELDLLLFADIGMHPLTYFLALWRLAPIQLTTWGHSVTSGIDTIDYYVSSDAIEAPGSEDQYTEELLRLPGYFMPRYERPALEGPRRTRRLLGLPEDAHVYYCPQSLFKLHPNFDGTLRAILEADPRAGILLMETRKSWPHLIRRRFERTLGPANAARVHFIGRMPQGDFLQYVAAADVILDPFYFGGCNSSCEALALGVPVVTLPSFQLPGRFTLGLYKEIGVGDCIAGSPGQYAEIAVRLAREPDFRRSISERISERCERLFDRPDTGRALGEALLRIVETSRR